MTKLRDRTAVFLLFLFAVGAPLSTSGGTIAAVGLLAAALVFGALDRRNRCPLPRTVVVSFSAFLLINIIATAAASPMPVRWNKLVEELWQKGLLLAIPVIACGVPRRVEQAVKVMVVTGCAVTLYAYYQHFTGRNILDGSTVATLGDRYLAVAFFDHHLTYGGQVMMLLLAAAAWLMHGSEWRPRSVTALATGMAMLGLALLWSFARSAQLGAFAGLVYLITRLPRPRRRWAILVLAVAIVAATAIPSVRQRAGKILKPGSEETRLNLWKSSVAGIKARPWLGYGRGNFGELMARHEVPGYYDAKSHAHNDFLMQMVNAGVGGLACYLALLIATGAVLLRGLARAGPGRWLVLAALAVMLGLSLAGFFQVYQTDDEVEMVFYFLLGCGLTLATRRPRESVAGGS